MIEEILNDVMDDGLCKCRPCGKTTCRFTHVKIGNKVYRRRWETPDWDEGEQYCHDCGVARGQFHHTTCDWEICPKCNGQFLCCGCWDFQITFLRVKDTKDLKQKWSRGESFLSNCDLVEHKSYQLPITVWFPLEA